GNDSSKGVRRCNATPTHFALDRESCGRLVVADSYKLVHEDAGHLVVEAVFDSLGVALRELGKSKFLDSFVFIDDGNVQLESLSSKEARQHSIQSLNLPIDPATGEIAKGRKLEPLKH